MSDPQTELHNRLAPEIVKQIVKEPISIGGGVTDSLIIAESVIVGVCFALGKLSRDKRAPEAVLDALFDGASKRMREIIDAGQNDKRS